VFNVIEFLKKYKVSFSSLIQLLYRLYCCSTSNSELMVFVRHGGEDTNGNVVASYIVWQRRNFFIAYTTSIPTGFPPRCGACSDRNVCYCDITFSVR